MFSVAGPILKSTGSVGLLLVYWLLGPVIALSETCQFSSGTQSDMRRSFIGGVQRVCVHVPRTLRRGSRILVGRRYSLLFPPLTRESQGAGLPSPAVLGVDSVRSQRPLAVVRLTHLFLRTIADRVCSSSATNCIVFAQYMIFALEWEWTPFRQSMIAVSLAVAAVAGADSVHPCCPRASERSKVVGASTKWALRAVNVITVIKLIALAL